MFLEFLKNYEKATDLDDKKYNPYFPKKVHRADALLFEKKIVCEHKEFKSKEFKGIDIESKLESLHQNNQLTERAVKKKLYKRLEKDLSKANKQIRDTKRVLECQDALGLVILENSIQNDFSVLPLIDAADRKMSKELDNVDCVLCVDFVNTFSTSDGDSSVRLIQVVARDTENSRRLCALLNELIGDFSEDSDTSFSKGFDLKRGNQAWQIDEQGEYQNYQADINLDFSVVVTKSHWRKRLVQMLNQLWWLMLISFFLYNWLAN
ncbi:MAG: hypothetical protein AAGI69_18755 [Cyanobacteria bacterium P01_H01_bin.21]